jgi:hypothetical protein
MFITVEHPWMAGIWSDVDTRPPANIGVTSIMPTKISRVTNRNTTNVTFAADEAFVEYQIRHVAADTDPITAGSLVEQATVPSRTSHTIAITGDELVAGAGTEGTNKLKIFVRDAAGNWSI